MVNDIMGYLAETHRNQMMEEAKMQRLSKKVRPDRPRFQVRWLPDNGELQVALRFRLNPR